MRRSCRANGRLDPTDDGLHDVARRGGRRGAASQARRGARGRRGSRARAGRGRAARGRVRRSRCTPRAPPRESRPSCVQASVQYDRKALAERAAGVEVGRERDRRAGVDERAAGRHRAAQDRARRPEQHAVTSLGRAPRRLRARSLEVVDGARAELDRQRDRADLGELVAVEAQSETRAAQASRYRRACSTSNVPRSRNTSAAAAIPRPLAGPPPAPSRRSVRPGCSGGTACAPSHVGTPPAPRSPQRRELRVVVEAVAALRPRTSSCRARASRPGDARRLRELVRPAARVARRSTRIPPPAASSSS